MNEKEKKLFDELVEKYVKERYDKLIRGFEQNILAKMSKIKDLRERAASDDNARKLLNEIIKSLDEKLTICHQKLMRL